jgi:GMP synthase-like glutamine amidotransferase
MKAHILQHVAFEDAGIINAWLDTHRAEVGVTRFDEAAALPDPAGLDLLVVMGGPMSVNDEAEHPWLVADKHFIAQAVAQGTAVLGICLGAQLIAAAQGARVYRNAEKEIGWFDIEAVEAPPACFAFPPQCTVMHWHGETFDLPPGAHRLAASAGCANQAFQLGERVIGLQFHLEMTDANLRAILANCRGELRPARFVQTEAEILDAGPQHFATTHDLMARLLDYLTRAPAH